MTIVNKVEQTDKLNSKYPSKSSRHKPTKSKTWIKRNLTGQNKMADLLSKRHIENLKSFKQLEISPKGFTNYNYSYTKVPIRIA